MRSKWRSKSVANACGWWIDAAMASASLVLWSAAGAIVIMPLRCRCAPSSSRRPPRYVPFRSDWERVGDMAGEGSISILVVDDESDLRHNLTRSFSREGHHVVAVADGRAAIDRATTDRFDIVL